MSRRLLKKRSDLEQLLAEYEKKLADYEIKYSDSDLENNILLVMTVHKLYMLKMNLFSRFI